MTRYVTKEMNRFLELHALELQINKIRIVNRYLADYEKYMQVLNFLNSYIGTIEKYIHKAYITNGEQVPLFVIIGSIVEIQDISTQKKHILMIKKPDVEYATTVENSSYEDVPFLSATGRSLLFKEVGQDLILYEGEANEFIGKIERIDYI